MWRLVMPQRLARCRQAAEHRRRKRLPAHVAGARLRFGFRVFAGEQQSGGTGVLTMLVLQLGFIGLSTPLPVAAPCPLLVPPSPARPSDNGAGIDGVLDGEVVQQVAD